MPEVEQFGKGVGRTSLLIAAWRARESEQVDPLYFDPVANIFTDSESGEELEGVDGVSSSTRHLINYRTRYFDDYLLCELNHGVKQVVILGAGLDARSLRFSREKVKFFEFDQVEVLRFKQRRLIESGYDIRSVFVEGNYILDDFMNLLMAQGLDPALETYLIWEGNSMYIPETDILAMFVRLRERLPCFKISFDYLANAIIRGSTGYDGAGDLISSFATMDAPWITGFDEIEPFASRAELEVIENKSMIEAIPPSSNRVTLDPDFFRYYSLCTLGSKG